MIAIYRTIICRIFFCINWVGQPYCKLKACDMHTHPASIGTIRSYKYTCCAIAQQVIRKRMLSDRHLPAPSASSVKWAAAFPLPVEFQLYSSYKLLIDKNNN